MGKSGEEQLLSLFRTLSATDRAAVLSFADFLASRSGGQPASTAPLHQSVAVPEPEPIPRPEGEKVVAAVKRLSRTYPMLDKNAMLGVTSDLMMQHVLQGREAKEVIDELEQAFRDEYDRLRQERGQ